jgi:ribosomal protein L21E
MSNKKAIGKRANTRNHKGFKLTIEKLIKEFTIGEKVVIKPNTRYHSGLPFRRFRGKIGIIEKKVGENTYMVDLKREKKRVMVGNAHLREIKA